MTKKIVLICLFLILATGCSKKTESNEYLTLPIFRDNVRDNKFYYQGNDDDIFVVCTSSASCNQRDDFTFMAGYHSKCYEVIEKDVQPSISNHTKFLPDVNELSLYVGVHEPPKDLEVGSIGIDQFNKILTNHFVEIPTIFEIHDFSKGSQYSKLYWYEYLDHGILKQRNYRMGFTEEGTFLQIKDTWYIEDESISNFERHKFEILSFTFFYSE